MGVYLGASVYNDSQVTEEWVKEQIEENGPGIFLVTYNVTTKSEIQAAITDGKLPVLKWTNTGGDTFYAPVNLAGNAGGYTFNTALDDYNRYTIFKIDHSGTWSKIDITAEQIFVCEYGVTTFADVKDAYDRGLVLYCKAQGVSRNQFGILTVYNNTQFCFISLVGLKSILQMNVSNADGWTTSNHPLENYDSALNSTSENAVQNKAIYSVIGDVETLLADL